MSISHLDKINEVHYWPLVSRLQLCNDLMFRRDNKCMTWRRKRWHIGKGSKRNIFLFKLPFFSSAVRLQVEVGEARENFISSPELDVGCLKNEVTFITIICSHFPPPKECGGVCFKATSS